MGPVAVTANPALDAEGHPFANYGLLDQQLALTLRTTNATCGRT
jgi:para-nitrobenzyl esterase